MTLETSENEDCKGWHHMLWESCSTPPQIEAAHEVRYLKGRYTSESKQEESESDSCQFVPARELNEVTLDIVAAKIAAARKKLDEQEAV